MSATTSGGRGVTGVDWAPATDEPVTANNAVIDRRLNLFM